MYLLPTAYLPCIAYCHYCLLSETITIEKHENFVKSTPRNRCQILGSNGIQMLTIPIVGGRSHKQPIGQTQICYTQHWQKQHWAAIVSAYNNSPFFEYYAHHFEPFYQQKHFDLLIEFNTQLLKTLLKLLKINAQINYTETYQHQPNPLIDLRHKRLEAQMDKQQNTQYTQVFENKMPFQANLSMLDVLFCEGNNAKDYAKYWQN